MMNHHFQDVIQAPQGSIQGSQDIKGSWIIWSLVISSTLSLPGFPDFTMHHMKSLATIPILTSLQLVCSVVYENSALSSKNLYMSLPLENNHTSFKTHLKLLCYFPINPSKTSQIGLISFILKSPLSYR